mmetsp:Transcript_25840/g.72131  ORF Transcript_25840/g.72131 Transcript_25840/m.72131 type:complete len:258 (+) Transcript_25840:43-816(+)
MRAFSIFQSLTDSSVIEKGRRDAKKGKFHGVRRVVKVQLLRVHHHAVLGKVVKELEDPLGIDAAGLVNLDHDLAYVGVRREILVAEPFASFAIDLEQVDHSSFVAEPFHDFRKKVELSVSIQLGALESPLVKMDVPFGVRWHAIVILGGIERVYFASRSSHGIVDAVFKGVIPAAADGIHQAPVLLSGAVYLCSVVAIVIVRVPCEILRLPPTALADILQAMNVTNPFWAIAHAADAQLFGTCKVRLKAHHEVLARK